MEKRKKWIVGLVILVSLILMAGLSQAAPIPGASRVITLQDGPNAAGLQFEVKVYFEVFDGSDAEDPLGITPGKRQYAYILEYISGNTPMRFFDVESTNGVPLLEAAASTNGTVNDIEPGTATPPIKAIITLPSGNPAARFMFPAGLSGAGTRSVILVFTASDKFEVGQVLAQITDSSLTTAGEVAGPVECFGVLEGSVFCLDCGPNGQIIPIDGVTIKVLSDTNEIASTVTLDNGKYEISGLPTGQYIVTAEGPDNYAPCSVGFAEINISCNSTAMANFCMCPQACTQQITVRVVCSQTGTEVAVPYTWVGICGPDIVKWYNTGSDGVKVFKGTKIIPGHYKVYVKPPKGYQLAGEGTIEFDLEECENKEVVFNVCPIPPCEPSVCIQVVEANDIPVENVKVYLKQYFNVKSGTTSAEGQKCFSNIKGGYYVAEIIVPQGYKVVNGKKYIHFYLDRCENKTVKFELFKLTYGPCPKRPSYWKMYPQTWPVDSMWVGADLLNKTQLMNLLNGKLANGSYTYCYDITVELAQYLIAVKLSIAAGSDATDIETTVIAADEFLLYDYPPGTKPMGAGLELAKKLKNQLYMYLYDRSYCQP